MRISKTSLFVGIFAITAIELLLDFNTPLGVSDWVFYFIPLLLTAYVGSRYFSYLIAVLFSLLLLVGFYLSPPGIDPHIALTGRLIGLGVFWMMAVLIARRKGMEGDLHRTERALRTISDCNQILVRATNIPQLLQEICRVIVEKGGYPMAWVGFAENDVNKTVRIGAYAGRNDGYLENSNVSWADTERGGGPTGTSIRTGQIVICHDFRTDPKMGLWREAALQRGFISSITLPLVINKDTAGALTIYASEARAFHTTEVELLKELAGDLDYGIQALRTRAEHRLAEERLKASEQNYREIFNATNEAIFLHEIPSGRILDVNDTMLRLYGYGTKEAARACAIEDFSANEPPYSQAEAGQHIRQTIEEGPQVFEWLARKKNGERFWTEVSLRSSEVAGQRRVLAVVRDISGRKRAEAEREQFFKFFQISTDLMVFADPQGCFKRVNPACLKTLGYTEAELLAKPFIDFVHPDDRQSTQDEMARQMKSGISMNFINRYRCKDGTARWLSWRANYVPEEGTTYASARDITERKRAEELLQQASNYNRSLIEASLDPLVTIGPDGRITDVNAATEGVTGCSRGELVGTDFSNYFTEPAKARAGYQQVFREGSVVDYPLELRHRDGKTRSVLYNATVYRDGAGKVAGVFAAARDITERKQMEERLRTSEAQHRGLFEHMLGGFVLVEVLCDGDGQPVDHRLLQANSGFDRMTGLKRSEEIGRRSAELSFKWPAEVARRYYQIAQGGEPLHWERYNESLQRCYDIRAFSPQKGQFALVFYDITARKQAEEANAKLATAVEQSAETIVITDTEGTIVYANPAFEKTTGYTRAEALGKNPHVLKSGKHDPEFYRRLWDTIKRGDVWNGHFVNRRKDGTLYEEEATISPIRDAQGVIINHVAVKRDVTREVQLEAQFRQSQKMEAIGQLAGGVAHDFNNILAVIQLQAGLLKSEQSLSDFQRDSATEIEKAGQRAAELTRQLLLFSRKQALQLRDLDLNDAITNISKMLRRTLGEQIQMQFKFAPQPLPIHADPGMIEQVLMNLTINARDAMPAGGQLVIETAALEFDAVTARQTTQARTGSFACITVADTGCGIPPEIISKIFEPFFTTKEVGKGTGLGLATVFGIIEQHQGWINVYSEVGRGTTFRIYLPCQNRPADKQTASPAPAEIRGGTETILLAEDDASVRGTIQKSLANLGYRVLEATNGAEAVEVWRRHRDEIHLLLTDIMMPGGMTGRELATQLLKENPKLKVIYASGYSAEIGGKDFPLEEGANYLAKPFVRSKLAQTVRNCLDAKE